MSFDLAIWAGDQPANNQAARSTFDLLMENWEEPVPPDPRVVKCMKEITGFYPDDWRGMILGSVWTSPPLTPHGSILYMNLRWGVSNNVMDVVASTAHKHGLICFDPQTSCVVEPGQFRALHESHSSGYAAFLRFARWFGWR